MTPDIKELLRETFDKGSEARWDFDRHEHKGKQWGDRASNDLAPLLAKLDGWVLVPVESVDPAVLAMLAAAGEAEA